MIEFADPFHVLLAVFAELHPGRDVRVQFGMPDEEPLNEKPGSKGVTAFPGPEDDGPPIITVDGTLDRGVQGSLDILAHELAHVGVGEDHEHDDAWQAAYDGLFDAFADRMPEIREVRA